MKDMVIDNKMTESKENDAQNAIISIVVPIYNSERYLEDCINSIKNQTYKKWELILVNDGSTDSSQKICEKYAEEDFRIQLINQKNQGVSVARNTGITNCSGSYITFVDSDDILSINYCNTLMNYAGNQNSLVALGMEYLYSDNSRKKIRYRLGPGRYSFEKFSRLIIDDGTFSGFTLQSACAILFSVEEIKKRKIYFRDTIKYNEDGLFATEYFFKCKKSVYINFTIREYYYRVNNDSTTHNVDYFSIEYNNSIEKINKILEEYSKIFVKSHIGEQIARRQASIALSRLIYLTHIKKLSDSEVKLLLTDIKTKNVFNYISINKLSIPKKIFYYFIKSKQYKLIVLMLKIYMGKNKTYDK